MHVMVTETGFRQDVEDAVIDSFTNILLIEKKTIVQNRI
jgi:hypothetical protein